MVAVITGSARLTSPFFSNRWRMVDSTGNELAVLIRNPNDHTSSAEIVGDRTYLIEPVGWGTVIAVEKGSERARITRRSWWGRRWELSSPVFWNELVSDRLPRRWSFRIGNESIARLKGSAFSYNKLDLEADVAVPVLAVVLAWHVLARPWEAAAAPRTLVPGTGTLIDELQRHRA